MSYGHQPDPIQPEQIDPSVRFSSIGGLKEHIKCLREMIIFPLLYPELFKRFNTKPAKGILFHGPPGTGKTLLARALANECSLVGGRRVSFFMRKGADVTDKWYGESEKNLRRLFQAASAKKPSIIFFDEIDALAPARRSHSENAGNSVVATLLAEMDGVSDRGNIIVIGATNRPDAIDPAVRRAGRFDRELYFPPPEIEDRCEILKIYTREWDSLGDRDLEHIARITVGYLGSDIKALCSEAVLKAVRRVYPQIYESDCKLLINAANVQVTPEDMLNAMDDVTPSGARYAPPAAKPLPPHIIPLLADQLRDAGDMMMKTFPARRKKCKGGKTESGSAPSVFLVTGDCADCLLAPALLTTLEQCLVKELSVSTLLASRANSPEQAVIQVFSECRSSGRDCAIFIRDLQAVWNVLANNNAAEVLLQLLRVGCVGERTLLLASSNTRILAEELREAFPTYKDCVYCVRKPKESEVAKFLQPVLTELPLVPPIVYQNIPPPPLPKAPTGPPENEQDAVDRLLREYDNLRELRRELKHICSDLSSVNNFGKFPTPEDPDQLPDFCHIVQIPMDLETVMSKIDNKQYYCAKEFLDDIDLICGNALLYDRAKPGKTNRGYRLKAFSLHDMAYSMVSDNIPAFLELECQLVARRRKEGKDDHEGPDPNNGWCDDFYISKLGPNLPQLPRSFRKMWNQKRHSQRIDESFTKKARMTSDPSSQQECGIVIKDETGRVTKDTVNSPSIKGVAITDCKKETDLPDSRSLSNDEDPEAKKENEEETVLIDSAELNAIMQNNIKHLACIGLHALIDLHAELKRTVYEYSQEADRRNLPSELSSIVTSLIKSDIWMIGVTAKTEESWVRRKLNRIDATRDITTVYNSFKETFMRTETYLRRWIIDNYSMELLRMIVN
ncbi:ATPase family associated with various cellular activities (AAA) domain-containing protein [Phthorimaea operculella]|nr:ATPase family associated with various cellular activities (AAA) domain-containing protein [Phthorimaea operculella]